MTATVASIRAGEDHTIEVLDELVEELTGPDRWATVAELCDAWRERDPEGWHSRRYAMAYLGRWLRAAAERGELETDLREGPHPRAWPKRVYRRTA